MTDKEKGGPDYLDLVRVRIGMTNDMIHREIRALHAYWERLRMGRDVPFRAEVDPRDMACDARNLFILEDLGAANLRFRLAGTALVEAFGVELRGMSARTIMAGRARESFAALIQETLAEPGIGYARLANPAVLGEIWEVLLLPLRSDFGAVDRVLGGLVRTTAGRADARPGQPRLEIAEMTIRPVVEPAERKATAPTPPPVPATGMAEPQAPFAGLPAPMGAHLTAIEGGRSRDGASADAERTARRPTLRIVRDE